MASRAYVRALLLLALPGCIASLQGNTPRAANKNVPDSFASSQPASMPAGNLAQQHWRQFFSSKELQDLIDTALKNNQELNLRLQEIIIAQNEVAARKGEMGPKFMANIGAGVEKVGSETSQGVADRVNGVPEHLGSFGFGLTATWEIDVFGKLRNAARAAGFRYLASIEGKNFVVTQIVAEIGRSYYELCALDSQIEVLKRNIEIQQGALEVVKIQKAAAKVTQLAVQRFEAEVLKNQSRLWDLEQERVQVENRINFLAGRYPTHVERDPAELMTPLPEVIAVGVPKELFENRPDIREAELGLTAAELDVKVARAGFYPSLSLDTGIGYSTFNIAHLVSTPESLFYRILGGLTAPIFNWSGISAQYRSANARQIQAVFTYERTLLNAVIDVANQLVKVENLQKAYELQQKQVETLNQSVEISGVLFKAARADYMEVLLTRRDALDAQMELIETKKRVMQAMVNVYQALGGGWRSDS